MTEYIKALITDINSLKGIIIEFPAEPVFTETENIIDALKESYPMIKFTHVQIIDKPIHQFTAVDPSLDDLELKIYASFKTVEEYKAFTQGLELGLSIELYKIEISRPLRMV